MGPRNSAGWVSRWRVFELQVLEPKLLVTQLRVDLILTKGRAGVARREKDPEIEEEGGALPPSSSYAGTIPEPKRGTTSRTTQRGSQDWLAPVPCCCFFLLAMPRRHPTFPSSSPDSSSASASTPGGPAAPQSNHPAALSSSPPEWFS